MTEQPSNTRRWLQRLLFIDPILATLLVLLAVSSGLFAYQGMIKEALPDLRIPMASIDTHWYGSSQSVMEKEVTERIERELRDLDHLKRYSSGSVFDHSTILVEFEADAPLDASLDQLRERVSKAADKIPKDADTPVVTQESMRAMPIASIVLHGDVTLAQFDRAATDLRKQLLRIPGITKVDLMGNRKRYVRVQLLPQRLRAHGLSPANIAALIDARDADFPLGVYEGREQPLSIKARTAFYSVEQLAGLPLKRDAAGGMVYLRDVARVELALYPARFETRYSIDGSEFSRGVALSIRKGDGQDTIKLVDAATALIERKMGESAWPSGLKYSLVSNNAEIIQQELDNTITNGWQSVLAVFAVLFFLLTWREATVAALSIPITFLGSIVALWLLGYTFNVMVIIGMVLALGLLVDDFILMMEGMHDSIHKKKLSFADSAVRTIRQFAVPSLAGTLTTILIFVPLANIGGLDGKFIRTIPVTAAVCLVVSFLVSIFISVPLSQYLLKRRKSPTSGLIDRLTERAERNIENWLSTSVTHSKLASSVWLGVGMAVVALAFWFATLLPVVLYPMSDGRNMGITVELPAGYKLEESREVAHKLAETLRQKPYLSSILEVVGERDFVYEGSLEDRLSLSSGANIIGFTMLYTPKDQREQLAYQYVPQLRRELQALLAEVPGHRLLIISETGGSSNEDPLQLNLSGPDIETLQQLSQQVQQLLRQQPGLSNIRDNLGQSRTEATVHVRQEMLDLYGISEFDFDRQLTLYLGDHKLTKLRTDSIGTDPDIRIETYWPSKQGKLGGPERWQEWQQISIVTPDGRWIPVDQLAELRYSQMPLTVSHKNGVRNVTIMGMSFSLTYNEIYQRVEPQLQQLKQDWPVGYEYRWAGEKELAEETYGSAEKAFVLAVIGVFAILVLQFRSFAQPLIILCTVIFGITGALLGFMVMAYPLSFPAIIGMIALAGINVNDGIVLVDTMNRHRREGRSLRDAAALGAADRFRPILSTTLTTLVGLMPLAIADESWRHLCAAIIFGELLSTVTAMIVVPALYRLLTQSEKTRSQQSTPATASTMA